MKRLLYFSMILLLASCAKPVEKIDTVNNPTSYVFERPKKVIDSVILSAFSNARFHNRVLSYPGADHSPIDTLKIFQNKGNQGDYYLSASLLDFSYGKSHNYFRDGEPLDYVVSFHLHLEVISESKTRVTVIAIKPRVIEGEETWPSGPHFVRRLKYLNAEPSTVEEYEILLEIGKRIGERSMPTIRYPPDHIK